MSKATTALQFTIVSVLVATIVSIVPAVAEASDSRVAVISGPFQYGHLFLVESDGSAAIQLTPQPVLGGVEWSPDASRIGFTGANDEFYDAYVMNSDGSSLTRITRDEESGFRQWSPDGSQILLTGVRVADADGDNVRSLGSGDSWAWSPDGQSVFFSSRGPGGISGDLWVVNTDGTEARQLTSDPAPEHFNDLSPDGSKILFSVGNANFDIWTMNLDGTDKRNLTASPFREWPLGWSPDGTRILFVTQASDPADWTLHSMAPDGSGVRRLTTGRYGAWSPDGEHILFIATQDASDFYNLTIGTVKADGTDVRLLTSGTGPIWSPDGTKIAFERWDPQTEDSTAYVMNADGTAITVLRDTYFYDLVEAWEPMPNRRPDCSTVTVTIASFGARSRLFRATPEGATDPDGDTVVMTVTGVTQDEPLTGWRDHTSPDALLGPAPDEVRVRNEASNKGDGRVYRISFEGDDGRGGSCSGTVKVSVPRKGAAIDSAPPSYDSFG